MMDNQQPLDPDALTEILALNRWQRARYGITNERDRLDYTAIRYRNEIAHVAGGHPEGYTIWPRTRADLSDPGDFTWISATTGWEAWRNGKPDKNLGTFDVDPPYGPMQVLAAARAACASCLHDAETAGKSLEIGSLDLFATEVPPPVDCTVFTVHEGEIYLDHAQIYAQYEAYRRSQGMPVHRTDSVRREMNRRFNLRRVRAVGPKGTRRFHIADVADYASFGFAGVEEVFGKSEAEILDEILRFNESPSEERRVPVAFLRVASRLLDALRAVAHGDPEAGLVRELVGASNTCHDILNTRYDAKRGDDARHDAAEILGLLRRPP